LRIPKTGSQSLQLFLQQNVGDFSEDVIARPISKTSSNQFVDVKLRKIPHNTNVEFKTAHVNAQFTIDHGICTPNTKFIGVIRNPYEKQISNYIYRIRRNEINVPRDHNQFIDNFREAVKTGILSIEKKEYHTEKQADFFKYNGSLLENAEPWLLDDLEKKLVSFCENYGIDIKFPLDHINRSKGDKKELIDKLYSEELKEKVRDAYKEDFELYNKLKGLS
jgi:hypothetical protein